VIVLAIESSCDECSAAVIQDGHLLSVCTRTQTVHRHFGGVVPELAGRSHLELVDSLTADALERANLHVQNVDLVSATAGPGLVGSLLVGYSYARGLAVALERRFRAVHHVEAHLFSAELGREQLPLPFLVLLVSGGHTLLVMVHGLRHYEVIGTTLDDALGEAYDKVGKLVGLTFPAGADVDKLAAQGNAARFSFPIAMQDATYDFSFSGLKTAFLHEWRRHETQPSTRDIADLLASFQEAALESVMRKVTRAVENLKPRAVVTAGGVAANSVLRRRVQELSAAFGLGCFVPALEFCGDNAAMIAYLAWKLETAGFTDDGYWMVRPRWPLEELCRVNNAA
jgi:N6-L-threonylcarbamoyladenine synthase